METPLLMPPGFLSPGRPALLAMASTRIPPLLPQVMLTLLALSPSPRTPRLPQPVPLGRVRRIRTPA